MTKAERRTAQRMAASQDAFQRAMQQTRRWRITWASGATVTTAAADYAGAKQRAREISPRVEPRDIVLID